MIYLYVKTHNKTGLKYLGKTAKDPFKYEGSGKWWKRHIKKHGYDVTTDILLETDSNDEIRKEGLYYSKLWNIVESRDWANLTIEKGDGGDTSDSEGFKESMKRQSIIKKNFKWWNNGEYQTFSEMPPDDSYIRGRLNFNNRGFIIATEKQRGKIWVYKNNDEMMVCPDQIPEGYLKGRVPGKHNNQCEWTKGTSWWNNGTVSKMSKECPGLDFVQGRLKLQK